MTKVVTTSINLFTPTHSHRISTGDSVTGFSSLPISLQVESSMSINPYTVSPTTTVDLPVICEIGFDAF